MPKFTPISVHLGDYLREQRQSAQLSLRQLSEVAGISNPYISQIERGLKKPSAEILQALAKALRISAESLYIRAGILDEHTDPREALPLDVTDAILADPKLNDRQRAVLLDVYVSFVGEPAPSKAPTPAPAPTPPSPPASARTRRTAAAQPTKPVAPSVSPANKPKSGKRSTTEETLAPEQSLSSEKNLGPTLNPTQKSSNKEKK